ncbi:electron transfer flavoprotein subunit beta [Aurantimonas sp. VKM B-3413]|uniref:electron transfer flavoprotein subunit beta n=1 Tax=Aurantimonas sp. VKM B-3413 TaxID=2779401 RepID=UPI001E3BE60B|nr:electron transfer flavoprotein subunit beta [Aurantimonas sp. VKM B-3413]MCB8838377.1 electron transfer flavoprotein subunit beta [Aurantimonas sp. VKM B-3413]
MRIVVLLSAGRHRVSGRPSLPGVEAQAIALAAALADAGEAGTGGERPPSAMSFSGLHAGPGDEGIADAFGHGLEAIDRLEIAEGADPLPALARHLKEHPAELILAGRRAEGGEDTGLLPYALAEALGLPILSDVTAIAAADEPGALRFDQALPKGAKRRVTLRLPAIVTVHPLAPAPAPFVFARARRGVVRTLSGLPAPVAASPFAEKPHRARPKLMRSAAAGSGAADEAGDKLHVHPDPQEAARLILDHIERIGIRRYS